MTENASADTEKDISTTVLFCNLPTVFSFRFVLRCCCHFCLFVSFCFVFGVWVKDISEVIIWNEVIVSQGVIFVQKIISSNSNSYGKFFSVRKTDSANGQPLNF